MQQADELESFDTIVKNKEEESSVSLNNQLEVLKEPKTEAQQTNSAKSQITIPSKPLLFNFLPNFLLLYTMMIINLKPSPFYIYINVSYLSIMYI